MNVLIESATTVETDLSDAFTAFITAANRLERSHAELHEEVSYLRGKLEDRNRELAASVAETERMRLELSNILDELPCGVVVVDARRQIVLANPEAHRLLNVPQDDALTWVALPLVAHQHLGALETSAPSGTGEFEFLVSTQPDRWVAIRCAAMEKPVGMTGRESDHRILILRDITAQKLADADRESSRHMVALAEIATVLAHEIRNPLAAMELLAGLLARQSSLTADSKQWIGSLQAGIRSLSATVNNVLNFHSNGSLHLVPINLATALQSALEFVRPLADQTRVELTVDIQTGKSEIAGDASAIQQVLLNLTCNALRHTRAGGRIEINAHVENRNSRGLAVVQFADTGHGVPFQHVEHLFEPGFSTSGQTPGLGLAVCQRILHQHGGSISAASSMKRGAMFHMELPIL
jgi:two-component system sensor histidine kinase FlrB